MKGGRYRRRRTGIEAWRCAFRRGRKKLWREVRRWAGTVNASAVRMGEPWLAGAVKVEAVSHTELSPGKYAVTYRFEVGPSVLANAVPALQAGAEMERAAAERFGQGAKGGEA